MSGLLLRVRKRWVQYITLRALVEHFAAATAALQPGGGRLGLWQSVRQMATVSRQKLSRGCTNEGGRK
jgi:hypothetical protein